MVDEMESARTAALAKVLSSEARVETTVSAVAAMAAAVAATGAEAAVTAVAVAATAAVAVATAQEAAARATVATVARPQAAPRLRKLALPAGPSPAPLGCPERRGFGAHWMQSIWPKNFGIRAPQSGTPPQLHTPRLFRHTARRPPGAGGRL